MVENRNDPIRLPWHGHILEKFEDGMRCVFECSEVDPLILLVTLGRHIAMVLEDFADVFGREGFFLDPVAEDARGIVGGEALPVRVALGLEFGPALGFFFE